VKLLDFREGGAEFEEEMKGRCWVFEEFESK
jgi:hypothetical protein